MQVLGATPNIKEVIEELIEAVIEKPIEEFVSSGIFSPFS